MMVHVTVAVLEPVAIHATVAPILKTLYISVALRGIWYVFPKGKMGNFCKPVV
jgi:hypothetical protein